MLPDSLTLKWLDKYRDAGMLLMRGGAGLVFVLLAWPAFAAGETRWTQIGQMFNAFGIKDGYVFFGLLIAVIQLLGGLLLIVGALTRFAATLLLLSMGVVIAHAVDQGNEFKNWSSAVIAGALLAGLMVMGPGRYSIDSRHEPEE